MIRNVAVCKNVEKVILQFVNNDNLKRKEANLNISEFSNMFVLCENDVNQLKSCSSIQILLKISVQKSLFA